MGSTELDNPRIHGNPPLSVVVLHGGPGALGGMSQVATELAPDWGVLEPIQTAASVAGQVEELRAVIVERGQAPVILIGSSWGAMLGFIFAARYPPLVRKLILVGSGVYEPQYATGILETRLSRLDEKQRQEVLYLMNSLNDPTAQEKDLVMARLGELFTKTDAFDPVSLASEMVECRYDLHQVVWAEAENMRRDGTLLELGRKIGCPVVAIHGDYDPHPAEGVQKPLSSVVKDFRFLLLRNCGHLPWVERQAKDEFFRVIRAELRDATTGRKWE